MENKRLSEGEVSGFKNRYTQYRQEVERTKNFDNQLNTASQKSALPDPTKTAQSTQANTQTTQQATQAALNNDEMLPNGQLSPKITQYMNHIKQAAGKYNLPPELIAGVIWQESRANPKAKSHCGAMGLMQLMPETASRLGVTNPWDAAQNIDGGAKYIRQMLDKFNGKVELAVAAYNAGPGNVIKHGYKIPPFKETQGYVPHVLNYASNFKASGLFVDSSNTLRA